MEQHGPGAATEMDPGRRPSFLYLAFEDARIIETALYFLHFRAGLC